MYRLVPMTRLRWMLTFVVVWPPSQGGKEFSQPSSESTHLSLTLRQPPPCLYFSHTHSSQCHIVMRFSVWAENGGENEISGSCSFRFSSPQFAAKDFAVTSRPNSGFLPFHYDFSECSPPLDYLTLVRLCFGRWSLVVARFRVCINYVLYSQYARARACVYVGCVCVLSLIHI